MIKGRVTKASTLTNGSKEAARAAAKNLFSKIIQLENISIHPKKISVSPLLITPK